ncbi:hypothetical protein H072_2290 [Dactylellina haptotyla CBS 200.50]|uniref:Hemerythrin-like domain-containing protein n=1 Tax=Dactylellina haptotyla (strain CBS 200.50) TaxID=1284197 RepID=S8ARP5_DACHA|nr:hypothetical protein H072_2290 [Dactylellina haptotyla CBS 200.50]
MAQLQYNDLNADKFPDPVEPIKIDKFNISAATVDMKDPITASMIGLFTVHALIRRSLRCVARQARSVEASQRPAFVTYAKATFHVLESHHGHEENLWFPLMKPYIDFAESSHEHEEIESLLHQNIEYMKVCEEHVKGGPKSPEWPGEEISSTTERLLELLLPHLQKEETLASLYGRRVPLSIYEEFEKKIQKAVMDEMKKQGMIWSAAYQFRHFNAKEKEIWPPMPKLVRMVFELFGWLGYGKILAFGPTEEELQN